MKTSNKIYSLLLVSVIVWCILIVTPPIILNSIEDSNIGDKPIYAIFKHICHQYDSRSIHMGVYKFAVCARCTGIYFGFLFGLIILPFIKGFSIKKPRIYLASAALPMIIDIIFITIGVYESNIVSRTVTGLVFGISVSILIYPTIEMAINEIQKTIKGKNYGLFLRKTR